MGLGLRRTFWLHLAEVWENLIHNYKYVKCYIKSVLNDTFCYIHIISINKPRSVSQEQQGIFATTSTFQGLSDSCFRIIVCFLWLVTYIHIFIHSNLANKIADINSSIFHSVYFSHKWFCLYSLLLTNISVQRDCFLPSVVEVRIDSHNISNSCPHTDLSCFRANKGEWKL